LQLEKSIINLHQTVGASNFSSEAVTMAMDAIKFRKGIFDLVVHNSFPLSFLNTCISKSEGKMARNFLFLWVKKTL